MELFYQLENANKELKQFKKEASNITEKYDLCCKIEDLETKVETGSHESLD